MGGSKEQQEGLTERINLYIPLNEKKELEQLADKTGETMSHWIRRGIREIIKKEKENVTRNSRRRIVKSKS